MSTTSNSRQTSLPSLTEKAIRNYKELFPKNEFGLEKTDPEIMEIFGNFAFGDVAELSHFNLQNRSLIVLAGLIGSQSLGPFRVMVGSALDVGVTAVVIKEILYQATAYVGMAKAFDFLQVTNEVFSSRGIASYSEKQGTTNQETRFEKGLEVQKSIFGAVIDQAYEQSPKDQLHIQKFLSAHCFGDFFTRSGLDLKTRELVILSMLVAMGGLEPQVKSHVRANITLGNDRSVLLSLMTQLLPWIGYPRTLNGLNCLNEIAPFKPAE